MLLEIPDLKACGSLRHVFAAREREDAAQKKQMELKQALDESGKRALALEHENACRRACPG
jgi:hypothetical protein